MQYSYIKPRKKEELVNKFIIDPKRHYERTDDGEINPSRIELGLNQDEYDALLMNNSAYIAQVMLFNQAYRQQVMAKTINKKERRKYKLVDHWFKTIDKTQLSDLLLKNIDKACMIASELSATSNNLHFRGYYMESIERIKPHNLTIPTAMSDNKLAGFPDFDGQQLYGTPTQFFRMYMAFFPPLRRKKKEIAMILN